VSEFSQLVIQVAFYFSVMIPQQNHPLLAGPYREWEECSHTREWLAMRGYDTEGCGLLPFPQANSVYLGVMEIPDMYANREEHSMDQLQHEFVPSQFAKDMMDIIKMYHIKNHDYAHGGDPMGNFKRVAAFKQLYPTMPWDTPMGVCLSYMLKQLDCVMWGMANNIEHKVEGIDDRLKDVVCYAAIARVLAREL